MVLGNALQRRGRHCRQIVAFMPCRVLCVLQPCFENSLLFFEDSFETSCSTSGIITGFLRTASSSLLRTDTPIENGIGPISLNCNEWRNYFSLVVATK